jgi:DNA-binding NtrC family response regulator
VNFRFPCSLASFEPWRADACGASEAAWRPVDVRIVAATNRDLQAEVDAGRFRRDLFFRLAVAVVRVPPVRNRLEDLPDLVHGLLADLGRPTLKVADATFAALRSYLWPGNVRELRNTLAFALTLLEGEAKSLEPRHLSLGRITEEETGLDALPLAGRSLEQLERVAIRQTLHLVRWNKAHAARLLGIAVSTLYEKMVRYELM